MGEAGVFSYSDARLSFLAAGDPTSLERGIVVALQKGSQ
jgi:hypothetical protein